MFPTYIEIFLPELQVRKKGKNIMIVRKEIDVSKPLTKEQLNELEEAIKRPIVYDEDCPQLTEEQLRSFHRVNDYNRKTTNISIRLSNSTLSKVKSLGKGYTSIMNRILEDVLNDNEKLKNYL